MFRLATLNDMIDLVAWRMQEEATVAGPWGLKAFGNLLCERYIETQQPQAVLEIGVGFNSRFHDLLPETVDYWTIDSDGFYDLDAFQAGVERRHRATHVNGLMGESLAALPEDFFDFVFSISALEHSNSETAPAICQDMFRVTKPGGYSVHTIDTPVHQRHLRMEPWHSAFLESGFTFIEEPDLTSESRGIDGLAVLVEPLDVQVTYYRQREDFWSNPHKLRDHQGTITVVAVRP